MNNFIEYFYNIKVKKKKKNNDCYSFIYNGYVYKLYLYDESNINLILSINKQLLGYTLISEIILNKDNNPISIYNGIKYLLIKIFTHNNKITLEDISYFDNSLYTNGLKVNWGMLWSNKIDYIEEMIAENGKKYPIIVDSFNYFVGLAENAISYYNSIPINNNYTYYISHKRIRINDTTESLYNPLNIIFDYKVRDVAEYIKNAFFLNNTNIFNELDAYLKFNKLSLTDIKLLIARVLYPSFYFELYEDILVNNKDEKIIVPIINMLPKYEKYLNMVITYFKKNYNIDEILWLKKNEV